MHDSFCMSNSQTGTLPFKSTIVLAQFTVQREKGNPGLWWAGFLFPGEDKAQNRRMKMPVTGIIPLHTIKKWP